MWCLVADAPSSSFWRCAAPALEYGVDAAADLISIKLPRWEIRGGEFVAFLFFKYFWPPDLGSPLLFLAGLGGEGEEERSASMWERGGFPDDEVDTLSGCEVLLLRRAPRWRSLESGTERCLLLPSHVWLWWWWFSPVNLLWPAVAAREEVDRGVGVLGGWPDRRGAGGKKGGFGKLALWLYAFIELGVRRGVAAGFAVDYILWRCSLSWQWWYGGSGED